MNDLRISLIQSTIQWEDKQANLSHFGNLIKSLAGKSDIAVLPETFTTGFSMNKALAETKDGTTINTIRDWAKNDNLAICGSFICREADHIYNRGFFITPEGDEYADKRHLFRLGDEHRSFSREEGNYPIFHYNGWNIRLIICYDLRFPVWIRNRNNEYDLLICSANWPASRANVWTTLLSARAIENLAYVCGVNRIGKDNQNLSHQGDSLLFDFKGEMIAEAPLNEEAVITHTINKEALLSFRKKFPVWKDSDKFTLEF